MKLTITHQQYRMILEAAYIVDQLHPWIKMHQHWISVASVSDDNIVLDLDKQAPRWPAPQPSQTLH